MTEPSASTIATGLEAFFGRVEHDWHDEEIAAMARAFKAMGRHLSLTELDPGLPSLIGAISACQNNMLERVFKLETAVFHTQKPTGTEGNRRD